MKRLVVMVFVAAIMAAILVGCGGSSTPAYQVEHEYGEIVCNDLIANARASTPAEISAADSKMLSDMTELVGLIKNGTLNYGIYIKILSQDLADSTMDNPDLVAADEYPDLLIEYINATGDAKTTAWQAYVTGTYEENMTYLRNHSLITTEEEASIRASSPVQY